MFNLRAATEQDLPFVMSSWLKSYRSAVHPRLVTDAVFFKAQHAVITKILASPDVCVTVACDPEDPSHIYGYLVSEQITKNWLLLHWTYVKGPFRKFGLCKAMLNSVIKPEYTLVQYTHRTKMVDLLDRTNKAKYNIFYVWSLL